MRMKEEEVMESTTHVVDDLGALGSEENPVLKALDMATEAIEAARRQAAHSAIVLADHRRIAEFYAAHARPLELSA